VKISLISFDFGEYCARLAGGLAKYAQVQLLLADTECKDIIGELESAVCFQPFRKARLRQPLKQLLMVMTILRSIRKFNPDIIHFQRGHLWFNLALPLLRRYPLVITIHDPIHHIGDRQSRVTPQAIMDFGFKQACEVIVHGNSLKQSVSQRLRLSKDQIHFIPHIIIGGNNSFCSFPEDDLMVLFFGRIWEYKGLEYLIRAEPLITERVPGVRIVIAGKGEDFTRYRKLMVHPERFIVYNEYISNSQREKLFQQASVIVLPYIDASQSGVIPLASNYGKPVVVTNVGALMEMVVHGQNGLVVPPRQVEPLADAIVYLLQNRELRHRMGVAARQSTIDSSPDVVARMTLEVYKKILQSQKNNSVSKMGNNYLP
jgi:glycosyltransferase involved in cell wall biosynthesis